MTTPTPTSVAIAQALGVSLIQAHQSPLHAARAAAEAQTHAVVVDALLARLGISPEEALARVTADTVDA